MPSSEVKPMRLAPKDGSLILIHQGAEGPPIIGYYARWWKSFDGLWINSGVGWEPIPT